MVNVSLRSLKTVRHMLSDRCLSCLSVTLVYCGQTVGWIRMPLGTDVGLRLGPGHVVLDGEPLPRGKGHVEAAPTFEIYGRSLVRIDLGPCLLWPNGWIDHDATCYGGRPRLRPHCVRWGPSSPSKRGESSPLPPLFGRCLLWANGWLSQDASWSGLRR